MNTLIEQNERLIVIDTLSNLIQTAESVNRDHITLEEIRQTRTGIIQKYNEIQDNYEKSLQLI